MDTECNAVLKPESPQSMSIFRSVTPWKTRVAGATRNCPPLPTPQFHSTMNQCPTRDRWSSPHCPGLRRGARPPKCGNRARRGYRNQIPYRSLLSASNEWPLSQRRGLKIEPVQLSRPPRESVTPTPDSYRPETGEIVPHHAATGVAPPRESGQRRLAQRAPGGPCSTDEGSTTGERTPVTSR